jgi:hypothetical protein
MLAAEEISPELALVDPELARMLREREPEPRREPLLRAPVPASAPPPAAVPAAVAAPAPEPAAAPVWRGLPHGRKVALGAAGALVFAALLATNHRVGRPPVQATATAAPTVTTAPAPPTAEAPAPKPAAPDVPPPGARTYYWPAVAGVHRYAVAFRKGPLTVYATETSTPYVVLPANFRFPPGSYTWTVSPVTTSGGQDLVGRPILESTFLISPR